MNNIEGLVRKLQDSLLGSHYGLDEHSYLILEELIGEVFGEKAMETLADRVDSTDGFFYYPEGNTVDYNEEDQDIMSELLAALDALEGATPDDEGVEIEDLEEVDLYDDLAD